VAETLERSCDIEAQLVACQAGYDERAARGCGDSGNHSIQDEVQDRLYINTVHSIQQPGMPNKRAGESPCIAVL
jgi:hypothetical protein